jgi:hypothetical protein
VAAAVACPDNKDGKMKESQMTREEADALMVNSHEAEDAGFKDLARYYADKAKDLYTHAEDLERQGR